MNHPLLSRVLLLDRVADERTREHQRRSTSAAAIAGVLIAFALLEYRVLVQHRIPWDLIAVIYAMGLTKVGLLRWYQLKN